MGVGVPNTSALSRSKSTSLSKGDDAESGGG